MAGVRKSLPPFPFAGYLEMTILLGLGLFLAVRERPQRVILGYRVVVMLLVAAVST